METPKAVFAFGGYSELFENEESCGNTSVRNDGISVLRKGNRNDSAHCVGMRSYLSKSIYEKCSASRTLRV